jgi:hypothetical protein
MRHDTEHGVELMMTADSQRLSVLGIPDASQTEAGRPKQAAVGSATRRANCLLRIHGRCSPSQAVLLLRSSQISAGFSVTFERGSSAWLGLTEAKVIFGGRGGGRWSLARLISCAHCAAVVVV